MRSNFLNATLKVAALAGVSLLLIGVSSAAAATVDVYLRAESFNKSLPGGVNVPMWGFASCNATFTTCSPASAPGPQINAAPTDTLTIHLRNTLGTPVSLLIPGQAGGGDPTLVNDTQGRPRVRSFTQETAPGATEMYTWGSVRAGTYLYESGTHPSIQVAMGLYGALVVGPATGTACLSGQPAYGTPKSCHDAEAVLVFSEIDAWQNQRVADAAALVPIPTTACVTLADWVESATVGYPCTVDYTPTYFLINGEPYDGTALPLAAGMPGDNVLLRFLNAGLQSHTPSIVGLEMAQLAEDGNPYPGLLKMQSAALLAAGKTLDVLVGMPMGDATYPLFDRMLDLTNDNLPGGGMLAYLQVGGGGTPPPSTTGLAVGDEYSVDEDTPLHTDAASGVLSNDDPSLMNATVVSGPSNGSLVLNEDGSFTYTPNMDFAGLDAFTYSASDGTNSYAALVTLNVSFFNDAPVAAPDGPFVNAIGPDIVVAAPGVLGNDADPDGDTLTAVLDAPFAGLTCPATLSAGLCADGSFTYTGSSGSFTYHAEDEHGLMSAPETVTLTVNPVANITLNVVDPDGASVDSYRWIVQEDRTYPNNPLAPVDPADTLSTNFHKSYMPVVTQGCVGAECQMDNPSVPVAAFSLVALDPARRYYVSVLPNDAGTGEGHTIGGAPIPAPTPPSTVFASPVTVIANQQPIPTAQISVVVFEDNFPTNGVPDPPEARLGGFQITLEDAGGRYGQVGGTMSQDAYGDPLKNSLDCAPPAGNGVIVTCADGTALIKDLPPGKYGVIAVAPPGVTQYTQTSTIEGTKVQDTWVKAGEPPFLVEFGAPGFHAFIGFVNPENTTVPPDAGPGDNTITGNVTMIHPERPPSQLGWDSGSYDALAHTRAWIGLNSSAGNGPNWATVHADPDGGFSIPGIPDGTYQLVIWDDYLDQIIHYRTVILPGGADVGNIPVPTWFGRHEHNVFLDTNEDGIRQGDEPGLPEQAVNLRFRDGTIFQSFPTDTEGFVPFDQIFPFGSWQVAEVDYTRFKATGVTVTVDGGGDVSGGPYPGLLNPQEGSPRTDTEPVPVLLEGFQSMPGMTSVFEWGKAPYQPGENGGISGIVFYSSTRGENDPRLTVGDPWEPGIPNVTVRLYREVARDPDLGGGKALALVGEVETDSWDANVPTGCPGEPPDHSFVTETLNGDATRCFDGVRNFEQVRPGALFDGGYAFTDIPPGKYVVEVVPPPGYEVVKEEDKNVDFGDSYITMAPVAMMLPGGAMLLVAPDAAMVLAALAAEPGLAQPPCVGPLHTVPVELSLFPGVETYAPFAGADRPLCTRKEVILSDQGQAASDFHLFTSTPVAGQFQGLATDDIAIETNPASPSFPDKWGPAFLPISMRDFNGKEIYRGYTDAFGRYNGLVPSTFTANIPVPSGYSPGMHFVCLNDPGPIPNPGGGAPILDPLVNPYYGNFCYTLMYMPGTTTYLDTPLLPQAAFAAGFNPVDCAFPEGTPAIASVDVQGGDFGPLVAPSGTLVIRSMGQNVEVPNPAYEGPLAPAPYNEPTIVRDLGFGAGGPGGATQGTVTLGGIPLDIQNWNANQIRVTAPDGPITGELVVTRFNGTSSTNAVTVTVSDVEEPIRVSAGGSIQAAIDAADPGDLILVEPGVYEELVVMWKPVRLQGSGAATIINAVKRPPEKLEAWRQKVKGLIDAGTVNLLPGQPAEFDLVGLGLFSTELGAGITVLAKDDPTNMTGRAFQAGTNPSRIDGFTITGADGGGGIFVNGYAHNLEISNNNITGNSGVRHGGIRVGHPFVPPRDDMYAYLGYNSNVNIHHNSITLNGGQSAQSVAGGVGLCTGTDNYTVSHNYICGNFNVGNAGGVGHLGLSTGGQIDFNRIQFNQSFNQGLTRSGGGLFIGGEPAAGGALTLGAGHVTVDANWIQGNQAGSGHGGGIRTEFVNGGEATPWILSMTNNMIVDNVAGWSGGGISLQDTTHASIVNNTITNNDTTATVGALVAAAGLTSEPQPAGISSDLHSPTLAAVVGAGFSDPELFNNIVWHNRAFSYDATAGNAHLEPVVTPASVGGCGPGANYWDLGVLGEPLVPVGGPQLHPTYSILTSTMGYDGGANNSPGDPAFVKEYCNGARTLSTLGPMQVAAEVIEGGNFIDVRFGPLTQSWPAASAPWNYHIGSGSSATNHGDNTGAPGHDFDNDDRPQGGTVEIGADELPPPPPGTVTATSASLGSLSGSTLAFGNQNTTVSSALTLTVGGGTPVTFASATVTNGTGTAFSKTGDTCSGSTVNPGATCTITIQFVGPSGNSSRTGTLTVNHDGVASPLVLDLTGS